MPISVSSPPVRHQTTEEPFLARGWMGQAWSEQPAAPRHSAGTWQIQHRVWLSEVCAEEGAAHLESKEVEAY